MATALELTPEQLQIYIENHRRRKPHVLTQAEIAEREALIAKAREAANMLREKYGVKRVTLFGSLAHQAWFSPDSDVDIMVEGIGPEYWRAWGEVEKIIGKRQVDLVDWDMASESLRRAVRKKGIVL